MDLQHMSCIVVKVGSSLIAPDGKGCSSRYLLSIAHFIVRCRLMDINVILVSSGSVAAGSALFSGVASKSSNVTLKKAMAAAGQTEMMAAWNRLFDFPSAQLLLTQYDLQQHDRFMSITETIQNLLNADILPIINENDAVITDLSSVGDNDNLSAMVASAVSADMLIICTDVNGLYDANPRSNPDARLLKDIHEITPELLEIAGGAGSKVGTGGMQTKLQAAENATQGGIPTILMNGLEDSGFNQLLNGDNPGTLFHPSERPLESKEHWLTYGTRANGELVVSDDVAEVDEGELFQLDYKDIVDVNGEFKAGETVVVKNENGELLAKGRTESGSCLLQFLVEHDKQSGIEFEGNAAFKDVLAQQEATL